MHVIPGWNPSCPMLITVIANYQKHLISIVIWHQAQRTCCSSRYLNRAEVLTEHWHFRTKLHPKGSFCLHWSNKDSLVISHWAYMYIAHPARGGKRDLTHVTFWILWTFRNVHIVLNDYTLLQTNRPATVSRGGEGVPPTSNMSRCVSDMLAPAALLLKECCQKQPRRQR